MNSFYVSGYILDGYDVLQFDLIRRTEKPRLTENDIDEIKLDVSDNGDQSVIIHLIYKLED